MSILDDSTLAAIVGAIDQGRGVVGEVLGQFFDVYRLRSSSSGSLVQQDNYVGTYQFKMEQHPPSKKLIEANYFIKVPTFIGKGAAYQQLQIGDVLVESRGQTYFTGRAFTFAYLEPMREYVFVSTPLPLTFSRPTTNPNKIQSGRVPTQAYNKDTEWILTLQNGRYKFARTGSPAVIYCGLVATDRFFEKVSPNLRLADDTPRQVWDAYCAELPGQPLIERDIINGQNGDRYSGWTTAVQQEGFHGWQMRSGKLRV